MYPQYVSSCTRSTPTVYAVVPIAPARSFFYHPENEPDADNATPKQLWGERDLGERLVAVAIVGVEPGPATIDLGDVGRHEAPELDGLDW